MHYVQIILIGIFAGSVYAIGGTGIVLTYKATGVFNLAHFTIRQTLSRIVQHFQVEQFGV